MPPEKIIDFLTLMGDKIDNVPGVPKCGEKTAAKWITEFGSVDGVIENAEKVKGKIGENLRSVLGFLPIALQLVTIKTDADLSAEVPSLESLKLKTPNRTELLDYYNKLEFRSWAKELKKTDVPGEVKPLETSTTAQKRAAVGAAPIEGATLDLFSQEQESEVERTLEIVTDETKAKELALHLEDLVTKEALNSMSYLMVPPSRNTCLWASLSEPRTARQLRPD